jgi:hypothetical protein
MSEILERERTAVSRRSDLPYGVIGPPAACADSLGFFVFNAPRNAREPACHLLALARPGISARSLTPDRQAVLETPNSGGFRDGQQSVE